jgi:hypothetical protein
VRDGGRPHDAASLARITRLPVEIFREAIPRLLSTIGWLEEVPIDAVPQDATEIPQGAAGIPQSKYAEQNRKELNRTEVVNTCASGDAPICESVILSIDNPPFSTTEPDALFSAEDQALTPQQERQRLKAQQDVWFEEWWAGYWLKRSRKRARDAFGKQVKTEARFREIMTATAEQSAEMLGREPAHSPHGATWLNGERWEDEAAPETVPKRDAAADALTRMTYGDNDK